MSDQDEHLPEAERTGVDESESCECPRCKELLLRLERLSYSLAIAQRLADVQCSM